MAGFLMVTLAIVVVFAVGVRQYLKARSAPKPLDDMLPTKAIPLTPPSVVPKAPVDTAVTDKPIVADGKEEGREFWEMLCALLGGKGETLGQKRLGSNGRFKTRDGTLYTVWHGEGVCVIVQAPPRQPNVIWYPDATRIICNTSRTYGVMSVKEPKVAPEHGERGIATKQALNCDASGMLPMDAPAIGLLVFNLRDAYRIGFLEPH